MKSLSDLDLTDKKYIIFDLDGTLIDSIGNWNLSDYKIIKELGNKEIDFKIIQKEREKFLEKNTSSDIYLEYCDFLIKKYDLKGTKEDVLKLRKTFSNEILAKEVDFKPNAVKVVKKLKDLGFILVLATATTKDKIDLYSNINLKMSSQLKLLDTFDLILTKDDVVHKKPNPEIYNIILKHYNVSPDKCLVFEDSLHGIIAAKKANIEVINVYDKYSDDDRKQIMNVADYSIKDYNEFIDLLFSKF